MDCSKPGLPVHCQLEELTQTLMSIESVMPSNHLILCHPLSSRLQSFPASGSFPMSQLFALGGQSTGVSALSINPSNECSGLIAFRMDLLDLLAVQETLKSLFQHHSLKASVLRHSAFFIFQLSHPYMTIGKTLALTRQTFRQSNVSAVKYAV